MKKKKRPYNIKTKGVNMKFTLILGLMVSLMTLNVFAARDCSKAADTTPCCKLETTKSGCNESKGCSWIDATSTHEGMCGRSNSAVAAPNDKKKKSNKSSKDSASHAGE